MNTIIVDANLLCLIVAGKFAPAAVGKHKRLKAYGLDDFDKVMQITSFFQKAATCPNVITETSNLLSKTNDNERMLLMSGLSSLLDSTLEYYTSSLTACKSIFYNRLGVTDAVLLSNHIAGSVLLTVDLDLVLAAQSIGRSVINYNWVRDDDIDRERLGL